MELWLKWAAALQAIAQNGLLFVNNDFDKQRYQQVREIASEILAKHSQFSQETWLQAFSQEIGYATPKIDVRGVVFSNQKILLVKEHSDGKWTLPGGWADINESASEAVKREVWEESGFDVQVVKLLAFSDKQKHDHPPHLPHTYKAFFLCQIVDGKPTPSVETSAVEFFTDNNLPDLSLPRVTPKQIARFFEHAANLDWPTDFD